MRRDRLSRAAIADIFAQKLTYGLLTPIGYSTGNADGKNWEFLCACGKKTFAHASQVLDGAKKSCGCLKFPDHTGRRFGRLVVIGLASGDRVGNSKRVRCLCDCGQHHEAQIADLTKGSTTSCGCYKSELRYRGYTGAISRTYWNQVKRGAAKRGLEVLISQEDAWDQYLAQDGRCALTGLPLSLGNPKSMTASLDRVVSTRPYEAGNIQWIYKAIQWSKTDLSDEDYTRFCRQVSDHRLRQGLPVPCGGDVDDPPPHGIQLRNPAGRRAGENRKSPERPPFA